jgi:hypothetical protein
VNAIITRTGAVPESSFDRVKAFSYTVEKVAAAK